MKSLIRVLCVSFLVFGGVKTASAATVWVDCTPTRVAAFANRVHVRCSASFSGIQYFAVGSTDTAFANRFLSIASEALVAGRTISVNYDPADLSGGAFACQTNDCRRAQGIEIK